ncbi:MAG: hypothetical protein ACREIF_09745 [Chthoniobacterales bacterium]
MGLQLSTEDFYRDFPQRAVPADVHGILLRVASLEDTLRGKRKEWSDAERRQSKRLKDLGDIARLNEAHPDLWDSLSQELKEQIEQPQGVAWKSSLRRRHCREWVEPPMTRIE